MYNRRKNRIDNEDYDRQVKRPQKNLWRCECDFVLNFCYVVSSFTVDNSGRTLQTSKDSTQFPNRPDLQELVVTPSCNFRHFNGCVPNYQQYIIGARQAGTLLDKKNELVDRLLTVMEIAPRHLDNNCLCAELSLINPSHSHLTAHQLKNL